MKANEKQKLLYPDGRHLALYFPAGLPERSGSCAFASMRCLVNCLTYLVHNSITEYTVNVFDNCDADEIANMMYEQVKRRKPKLVEWFCWGDCMPERTEKVLAIMKGLSEKRVVQCGFTRNIKLWRGSHKIENIYLGYTFEDKYGGEEELAELAKEGLVGVPDYNTGETKLYLGMKRQYHAGSCGSSFYQDEATKVNYEAECIECYKHKRGCFTKRK